MRKLCTSIQALPGVRGAVYLTLFLLFLVAPFLVQGQVCAPATGGVRDFTFSSTTSQLTFYPGEASGTNTYDRSTVGRIRLSDGATDRTLSAVKRTIRPRVGVVTGKVILTFFKLTLSTGSSLSIYRNTTGTGTPELVITPVNASSLLNTERIFSGDVTLVFTGNTGTVPENVNIRYNTGDETFTTCRDRTSAVWKAFILPNSFVNVDDMEYYQQNAVPICVGEFDSNKQFVRSEIAFCIRHDLAAATPEPGYSKQFYFGQVSFSPTATGNSFDIDASGSFNNQDQLKSARIMWLLVNSPTGSLAERRAVQVAIWQTLENAVTASLTSSLAQQAQKQVPTLPNPPEPVLSLTNVTGSTVPVSAEVTFALHSNAQTLSLAVSSGAKILSVTNGRLATDVLTIADTTKDALITVSRSTSGKATLTATYNVSGYWNLSNLEIYQPCDTYRAGVQPFLGLGQGDNARPFRAASAEWTSALPVTLAGFGATAEGTAVLLNWATSSEENTDRFEVEHSLDGRRWQRIGTRAAVGESKRIVRYSFRHENPADGPNYYRLAMIDQDLTQAYSPMRSVVIDNPLEVSLFPNPVTGGKLFVNGAARVASVEIVTAAGAVVRSFSGGLEGGMDTGGLSPGVYLVKINGKEGSAVSRRIMVAR